DSPPITRDEAVHDFVARWAAVGMTCEPKDPLFRRPCAGFHPQVYAHAHADALDRKRINPLAHFIRSGRPQGPWKHDVISPFAPRPAAVPREFPATAMHVHFHYPELAEDFIRKLAVNGSPCDLLLSTDEAGKARMLRRTMSQYRRGKVQIRVL